MNKKSTTSPKTTNRARAHQDHDYVVLKDGRKLVKPVPGGKFKKIEIRKAVFSATSKKTAPE